MKVRQRESIILKEKKEYVLIPYIKEEGIKKEWLQFLLPLDGLVIDELIKDGGKSLIFTTRLLGTIRVFTYYERKSNYNRRFKRDFWSFWKEK